MCSIELWAIWVLYMLVSLNFLKEDEIDCALYISDLSAVKTIAETCCCVHLNTV